MERLHFSNGNSKLAKTTLIFSLPAGITCPGAKFCLSVAVKKDGKVTIKDGKDVVFRCSAASQEALYPSVFNSRRNNLRIINDALNISVAYCANIIKESILDSATMRTDKVRIHESGDFFSLKYLLAWLMVARTMPQIEFYCYSKNLPLFLGLELPENFYMVASYGGKYDSLIDNGTFPVYSKVVNNLSDAKKLGLPVDIDDSHCFTGKPFALLIHGVQPKGTQEAKASYKNRKVIKELKKAKA